MASHDNLARSSASDLLSVEGKTGDTPPTVFHTPSTEDPPVLVLNAPLTIPMSFSTSDPRTRLERSEASTPPSVVVPPAPAPSRSSDRDIVVPALPLPKDAAYPAEARTGELSPVLEGDHKHKYDEGGYDYRSDHSTYSQDDNERPVLKPAEKNGSGELGHFDHNANYHLGCTECTAPSHEFSDRSWYARDEYAERRPAPRDMYASPAAPDPYAAGEEDDKPRAPGTAAAKLAQTDDVYAAYPPEPAHDGWLRRLFRKMKV